MENLIKIIKIKPPADILKAIGLVRKTCLGLLVETQYGKYIKCHNSDQQTNDGCRGPGNDPGCPLRNQAIPSAPGIPKRELEKNGFKFSKS